MKRFVEFLSFLGDAQTLHGVKNGEQVEFTLPPVERGAAVWVPGKGKPRR